MGIHAIASPSPTLIVPAAIDHLACVPFSPLCAVPPAARGHSSLMTNFNYVPLTMLHFVWLLQCYALKIIQKRLRGFRCIAYLSWLSFALTYLPFNYHGIRCGVRTFVLQCNQDLMLGALNHSANSISKSGMQKGFINS